MTAIARVEAELATIAGSALAGRNITGHVLYRYLRDATDLHNTGHRAPVPDAPPEELAEQVPEEHKAALGTIMLSLVAVTRAAGGPACPETGLPMAYAAEAVLLALRQHRTALQRTREVAADVH